MNIDITTCPTLTSSRFVGLDIDVGVVLRRIGPELLEFRKVNYMPTYGSQIPVALS